MTKRRTKRVLAWIGGGLVTVIAAAAVALVIYSEVGVMTAEPQPLAEVRNDPDLRFSETDSVVVMVPADHEYATGQGLVFVPGAKVSAGAYAAKLAGLVTERHLTVVIAKPWLNLALFDLRGLASFTEAAPEVTTWAVGGHSLGGVRACMLAGEADALVLFGSYCATDLSQSDLPVLSVGASEDGLSTPQKIADAAADLPADAEFVQIEGANHASFGDYGIQSGDGVATLSDADMAAELTGIVGEFLAETLPGPAS